MIVVLRIVVLLKTAIHIILQLIALNWAYFTAKQKSQIVPIRESRPQYERLKWKQVISNKKAIHMLKCSIS